MEIAEYVYKNSQWDMLFDTSKNRHEQLIILFGPSDTTLLAQPLKDITQAFPDAIIMGCSDAGRISGDQINQADLVMSVVTFKQTKIDVAYAQIKDMSSSYAAGISLGNALNLSGIKGIFLLSDGLNVNGSKLTEGICSTFQRKIPITGGLAGDDDRFAKTWVLVNNEPKEHYAVAIGFYGETFHMSYASRGGWDPFGIERQVTSSRDNILYELDGQPALSLYKTYLGDRAEGLPATALLFPLSLRTNGYTDDAKVRTVLGVNEDDQSITFAGDIPENCLVTFMHSNIDRLVEGAAQAADEINLDSYHNNELLCIAISCVGRRLVMDQRTEEELEAVLEELPPSTKQIGFYSYGEISPLPSKKCDLHNQTMTLSLLWEDDDA